MQHEHFTIPKRLIYYFSDYTKMCLEGHSSEAKANAVNLPDVDPDVFQVLWQWLYQGELGVRDRYRQYHGSEQLQKSFRMLCQVYFLGERLLFDDRLFWNVLSELGSLIEEAKTASFPTLLTPAMVEDVFVNSAPVRYEYWQFTSVSLRPWVLDRLRTFDFCTTVDFMDYTECFQKDGAFAAELMIYMTDLTRWAMERWGRQTDQTIDAAKMKKWFADDPEPYTSMIPPPPQQAIWSALKVMCTSAGCTADDLRAYSSFFELNPAFTVELLGYMAAELRWTVYWWGWERWEDVDWAAEKEEEWRELEEKWSLEPAVMETQALWEWT